VGIALRQYGRLLDESRARALWLITAKPAHLQVDHRLPTGNRQIAEVAFITAVERF
jgi:hypothetical protein